MSSGTLRVPVAIPWLALASAVAAAALALAPRGPRVIGGHSPMASRLPAREAGLPYLSVIAVGDVGTGEDGQRQVALGMARKARLEGTELVLLLGDNFYDRGVTSVEDPRFLDTFERVYDLPGLEVPFYAVLGNHDHYGSVEAQVDYSARSARWRMPAFWYSFRRPLGAEEEVLFIGLDTNAMLHDGERARSQRDWLEGVLAFPRPRWTVVFGHHPCSSARRTSVTPFFVGLLLPVLARARVDLYLCGHDHHLALMRPAAGPPEAICGAGSHTRSALWNAETDFADARLGFVHLRFSPDELAIEFLGSEGQPRYATVLRKKAPRRPLPVPTPAAPTPARLREAVR